MRATCEIDGVWLLEEDWMVLLIVSRGGERNQPVAHAGQRTCCDDGRRWEVFPWRAFRGHIVDAGFVEPKPGHEHVLIS